MNNKYIQELTSRLSDALDQNYDVVNLEDVLSVISALEGATITKEQLEATRLAKYINQLRRRTKSEHLARRAKSLLKRWREMVGIQQQANESLSNQNVPAATSTQHHQLYHRSQPTSPNVGGIVVEQVGIHNTEQLNSGDDFRYNSSNPAFTRTSTGQSTNYNNKRLGAVSVTSLSNVPIPTVPVHGSSHSHVPNSSIANQKQPTSFANLLTGIYSGTGGSTSGSNITDPLSSPISLKFNKRKERNSIQAVGGASIGAKGLDQSSSNADFSRSSVLRHQAPISNIAPIVIDIQDSNSDSEVIASTPPPTIPTIAHPTGSAQVSTSKLKKCKKDKKRKQRETQPSGSLLSFSNNVTITNVIDESCSNQQKPGADQDYQKFVPIVDEISHVVYPITGISEILSLSNSSISSMFPNSTAVAKSVADCVPKANTQKVEALFGTNSNSQTKSISKSDLTFAGKFKQHSTTSNMDLFVFDGKPTEVTTKEIVVNDSSSLHLKPSSTMYSFVPFSTSVCNSNDSTSNSRISQFDIIDVVNQDNSQSKIIDELRQQHIEQNIISTQQMESQQKHRKVSDQILTPPTATTNLRQFNNVVECNNATIADSALPKKRGRKKGSKGVDSIIAKETSLCSQMLTTLGCKKVKTTKELYTEMQNRKLGVSSTTSSPTMSNWLSQQQIPHISRPNSSCSELSLQSPRTSDACSTNATVSTVATRSSSDKTACYNSAHGEIDVTDSETNTSAHSHYSATVNSQIRRRPSTDSTSNSQLPTREISIHSRQPLSQVTVESLKQQIKELLLQLPPVPSMETIEWESIKDVIPCTCKVIECEPVIDQQFQEETKGTKEAYDADVSSTLTGLIKNKLTPSSKHINKGFVSVNSKFIQPNRQETEADIKCSHQIQPPHSKPIKSIFDLDFDDDEDPLHQIRAEAAAAPPIKMETDSIEIKPKSSLKQESLGSENIDSIFVLTTELHLEQPILPPDEASVQMPPPMIFPSYSVEEDPKCEAKQRFELQTQKITRFHITALHNCYIPNVNGNWDNAETTATLPASITSEITTKTDVKKKNEALKTHKLVPTKADLSKNVVPQYGSHIFEYIPKDLSHITFTPNFIPKKNSKRDKPHYFLPFLGVARRYMKSKVCSKKQKLKKTHEQNTSVNFDKVIFEEDGERFSVKSAPEQDGDDILKETNNNDHVYVICNTNREYVDISLLGPEVETKTEHGLINEELSSKSVVNDSILILRNDPSYNPLKLPSDNNVRNNTVMYSGITIDITEDASEKPAGDKQKINCDLNTQNLLTFAKVLPCDKSTGQMPQNNFFENAAIYQSYENQNDQNVNNNSASTTSGSTTGAFVFAEDKVSQLSSSSVKYVDSRRSSSCSNSSLKQTQNSINMKLRRKRLQQHKEEEYKKLSTSTHIQQSFGKRSRHKGPEINEKKPRIIKTIKLSINGSKASQLPYPMGSSSNSTDDDSSQFEDDVMDEYNGDHKKRFSNSKNTIEDNNDDSNCNDDEGDIVEDEFDEGDCDDYDDDYGCVGDYHEVVTRNISATSTDNNHIVLTIKKTPSKTNSPSDSHSSMSPVVNSSQEIVTKGVEIVEQFTASTGTTQPLNNCNDVLISSENDILEVVLHTESTDNLTIQTQDQKNAKKGDSQNVEDTNTSTHIEKAASPTFLTAAKCIHERRMRKTFKVSKSSIDYTHSNLNQKLHNQLFFWHELETMKLDIRRKALSSCSSSCVDNDCEYDDETNRDKLERKAQKTHQSMKPLPKIETYRRIQKNSNEIAQRFTARLSSHSTDSSHESEDEIIENAAEGYRKKSEVKGPENRKEEKLKQSTPQKKKMHRSITPKRMANDSDKSVAVVKIDVYEEVNTMAKPLRVEDTLAIENNGLLHSFNNIYMTPEQVEQNQRMLRRMNTDDYIAFIGSAPASDIDFGDVVYIDDFEEKKKQQEEQHPNNNCDVYSNFYNYKNNYKLNNSFNNLNNRINSSNKSGIHNENDVSTASRDFKINIENECETNAKQIKTDRVLLVEKETSSTQKLLVPHKEYRTGLRAVDEDVDDEDGNNCGRIQQFKEWHQVLQLRSYNDELLTVMPYVVLE